MKYQNIDGSYPLSEPSVQREGNSKLYIKILLVCKT